LAAKITILFTTNKKLITYFLLDGDMSLVIEGESYFRYFKMVQLYVLLNKNVFLTKLSKKVFY